uniref:Synthetic construct n=1 Tax=synthetic construct TaxID=32630 RepID=UPI000DF0CE78|nr:Chain A, Synthetic construct [synthetic construct]
TIGSEFQNDIPDLYSVFKDYFPIGVAVDPSRLNDTDPHAQLTAKHFNMLTAENAMKPESLEPEEGRYNFEDADRIVAFAEKHGMKMRGHTLVWHQQVPDWFFLDENGNPMVDETDPKNREANREELRQRMENHIKTVAGRYKGKIYAWDVVNEVFNDDGTLRNSAWYQIIGPDYIEEALRAAHEADPNAKLFINDYNIENWSHAKTQAMYNMVRDFKERGVPVDGVGMQGHISLYYPSLEEIEKALKAFAALGVEIMITELDVNTQGDVSPDALQEQAERMRDLFELFKKHSDKITGVTFWGVADDQSWKNNFPVPGRTNAPLLFDRNYQPKPAFWAIV